jgi:hypothetical protein
MKNAGILILIVISFSILSPLNVTVPKSSLKGDTIIFTLNVCSKNMQGLASASDMPTLFESFSGSAGPEFAGFYTLIQPICNLSLFPSVEERPPKA